MILVISMILVIFYKLYDLGESGDNVVFGNSGESDDSGESSTFLIW